MHSKISLYIEDASTSTKCRKSILINCIISRRWLMLKNSSISTLFMLSFGFSCDVGKRKSLLKVLFLQPHIELRGGVLLDLLWIAEWYWSIKRRTLSGATLLVPWHFWVGERKRRREEEKAKRDGGEEKRRMIFFLELFLHFDISVVTSFFPA